MPLKNDVTIPLEKRTKCMVYTRVMGYHRPVESFNVGKKGEHKERLFFEESQCHNKH
ncbi:MAG: anaerobic ribonucleoside-triphosphate reductase [Wolinella sp.]